MEQGRRPSLAADADKEKAKEGEKKPEPVKVQIDFDGLGQRILAMPIPARNYFGLSGREGRRSLSSGRSPGRYRARPAAHHSAKIRAEDSQDGKGRGQRGSVRSFL